MIIIFTFAILFAYLINPVVRSLQRHSLFFKNLRGPHVLEVYLALLILIVLVVHGLGLFSKTAKLLKEVPTLVDGLATGEIATELGGKYGWSDTQVLRFKTLLVQHRTDIQGFARALERSIPTAIGGIVVIPILAIFFLSDGANLANSLIRLVSTRDKLEAVQSLADDLNVMLQHYIGAKVTLVGLSFIFYSVGMPPMVIIELTELRNTSAADSACATRNCVANMIRIGIVGMGVVNTA